MVEEKYKYAIDNKFLEEYTLRMMLVASLNTRWKSLDADEVLNIYESVLQDIKLENDFQKENTK